MQSQPSILALVAVSLITASAAMAGPASKPPGQSKILITEDVDRPASGIYQHRQGVSLPSGSTGFSFEFPNVEPGTALIVQYVSVRLPRIPEPGLASCLLNLVTASGTVSFHLPIQVPPTVPGSQGPIVAANLTGYHTEPGTPPFLSCAFTTTNTLTGVDAAVVGHVVDL